MADKKPLANYSGTIQEVAASDSLAVPSVTFGDGTIINSAIPDYLNANVHWCDFWALTDGSLWGAAAISSGTLVAGSVSEVVGARGVAKVTGSSTANSGQTILTRASFIELEPSMSARMRFKLL